MRAVPPLVVAHAAVIALAWHELASRRTPSHDAAATADTVSLVDPKSAMPAESLSVAQLSEVDSLREELMLSIQQNDRDLAALAELAHLYMRHGWFARAIGPLAHAVEVDASREDLFYELRLAARLSGRAEGEIDFTQEAAAFMEEVEMMGHGC